MRKKRPQNIFMSHFLYYDHKHKSVSGTGHLNTLFDDMTQTMHAMHVLGEQNDFNHENFPYVQKSTRMILGYKTALEMFMGIGYISLKQRTCRG